MQHQEAGDGRTAQGKRHRHAALEGRFLAACNPLAAGGENHDQQCRDSGVDKVAVEIAEGEPERQQDDQRHDDAPGRP